MDNEPLLPSAEVYDKYFFLLLFEVIHIFKAEIEFPLALSKLGDLLNDVKFFVSQSDEMKKLVETAPPTGGWKIQIKNSNFKKMSNFVKICKKEKILILKEIKNEIFIQKFLCPNSVKNHKTVADLTKIKKFKESQKIEKETEKFVYIEKFKPAALWKNLFSEETARSLSVKSELARVLLNSYSLKKCNGGTTSFNNNGDGIGGGAVENFVVFDEKLANSFNSNLKKELKKMPGQKVPTKEFVDEFFRSGLIKFHTLALQSEIENLTEKDFKKGGPKTIEMKVKKFGGGKNAHFRTDIEGPLIDEFHLDLNRLSSALSKNFSTSSTVYVDEKGRKAIHVMGNRAKEISDFFKKEIGLPEQCLKVL